MGLPPQLLRKHHAPVREELRLRLNVQHDHPRWSVRLKADVELRADELTECISP